MSTPEEKKADRVAVLLALYELSDGDTMQFVGYGPLASHLDMSHDHVETVVQYLSDKGLSKWRTAGSVSITTAGIDEAERLAEQDGSRTSTIIDVDLVEDLAPLTEEELGELRDLVARYRELKTSGELGLGAEDEADTDDLIAKVEAEANSAKPRRRIVKAIFLELGRGARAVLHALAGEIIKRQIGMG